MKLKLIIALLLFQLGFSQQRTCGTDAQMQKMMSDPVAKQKHLDFQKKFNIELAKLQDPQNEAARNTNATIIIPVAVHFPEITANSPIKECLKLLIQNQIDILNAAFSATNPDIALWTPQVQAFYPGTNLGNPNIKFIIATKNHPAGTGLTNGQAAITFGTNFLYIQNGDHRDIQWKGYLNIVCRDTNLGSGYYTGGTPDEGNLIVLKNNCFGSGTGCGTGFEPYFGWHLGGTAIHEVAHYLSVHHTFGKDGTITDCSRGNTDDVDDTPQCQMSSMWPEPGSVAGCVPGTKSLTMNYMDYTLDGNKFMFTAGQVVRMRAYYNTVASQFATNVLGEQDFEFKDFSLFPNPNNGSFKISFTPETNEEIAVEIIDMNGRNIYSKTFQNLGLFDNDLQINNISSGMYFLNIQNGKRKMVRKIIKK